MIKVKLTTEGVDDEYLKDISITPAEIIIPAGEKTSGDITWEITNDFCCVHRTTRQTH